MLYRSIQLVQAIIDESRVSMEEILDKGAKLAAPAPAPIVTPPPSSAAFGSPSSPSTSSPTQGRSSFDSYALQQTEYTDYGDDLINTITPLIGHQSDAGRPRPASFAFSSSSPSSPFAADSQQQQNPFHFDAFSPPSPQEPPSGVNTNPFSSPFHPKNPFNAPTPTPVASVPAQDGKSVAALAKLRSAADERYQVFVTTCASLLNLIPEERVFKVAIDSHHFFGFSAHLFSAFLFFCLF